MEKPLSRLPQGGEAKIPTNQALTWKIVTAINQPAPFPFGKGGGIGPNGHADYKTSESKSVVRESVTKSVYLEPVMHLGKAPKFWSKISQKSRWKLQNSQKTSYFA